MLKTEKELSASHGYILYTNTTLISKCHMNKESKSLLVSFHSQHWEGHNISRVFNSLISLSSLTHNFTIQNIYHYFFSFLKMVTSPTPSQLTKLNHLISTLFSCVILAFLINLKKKHDISIFYNNLIQAFYFIFNEINIDTCVLHVNINFFK